jgi:hypothetical protein
MLLDNPAVIWQNPFSWQWQEQPDLMAGIREYHAAHDGTGGFACIRFRTRTLLHRLDGHHREPAAAAVSSNSGWMDTKGNWRRNGVILRILLWPFRGLIRQSHAEVFCTEGINKYQ